MLIDEATLLDNIGKIIVFLMLLFTVFLTTVKSEKKLPNFIFAIFILVTAFDISGLFVGHIINQYLYLHSIKVASSLLQMPLFYFYVLSVCYSDFAFRWKYLLHTLLFAVFLGVFILNLLPTYVFVLFEIAGEIQYVAYIVAIFYVLKKHKAVYLENFSNPDYTAYKWLFQATVIFCIAHFFVFIRSILGFWDVNPEWGQIANIIVSTSALLVTCWLVMKAMYKPQLFMGVERKLQPIIQNQSSFDNKVAEMNIKRLKELMSTKKPYLDSELSLEKLSIQIQIDEKELSVLINHHLGKHFFDFINEYRINDAKAILENQGLSKMTVLEILYKVGFNSKSSFYTAFKKQVGQTPVAYRKSVS